MSTWLVREARREDWPKIRRFFKELDSTSRYMYFGGHVSDDIIDRVWERFESRDSDKFFVVDLGDQIIGMCQVACVKNHGEISVAVHPDHRQQSIAHSLVERAVVWCKTHDILDLMMFCLPNHNIIQRIIQKHNLLPLMLAYPAEAKFTVPPGSVSDYQQEVYNQSLSWWMNLSRQFLKKLCFTEHHR
jgi:N-acetylglutamate synthase-like GNAT family acetyltransferase